MQAHDMTMADYAGILRRRWRPALLAGMLVAFSAVYLAFTLPAVYESSATILIEQQEIPEELVQTTISRFADERLQSVRQRVMSTQNVTDIIQALDLYPDQRATSSMEDLADQFRADSGIEPLSVTALHARSGRASNITYAFQVTFSYAEPKKARDVVDALSKLWLAENESLRIEAAARTSRFLDGEVKRVEEQLAESQARLAEFKEQYADSLP